MPTWLLDHGKSKRVPESIYFCYIDYAKAFDCGDHNKLWKILKEMGIPDHLTCLLRNLYAGQEATVRTGHGTTDCFQIGKGVRQACILLPCLFILYAEYIMRSTGLEEAQAGMKIARGNMFLDKTVVIFCLYLTVWITINCGKSWKRWEYQTTYPASWEICMQVRKQQLELDMEQQTGSK